MKRLLTSLCIFLVAATTLLADALISTKDRLPNVGRGFCSWCATETAGRYHGIERLRGLVERKRAEKGDNGGGATHRMLSNELQALDVNFKSSYEGSYNIEMLREALNNDFPCVVGVFDYPHEGDYHAILITSWHANGEMRFVDSNSVTWDYVTNWTWFWEHWDGAVLVVLPEAKGTEE